MRCVLALDQGTTSSRAILFDRSGGIVALARRELPQIYPRPGWVEHDPDAIWSTQLEAVEEVLGGAGLGPADLAAVGITNQRETTILWDRETGRPIHNAIVWQDRRTAELCERLKADGLEEEIRDRTGLVVDPYFSGTKLAWLLDHVDGARERAEAGRLAFGTVDSWLVWKLTGGAAHVTDTSNASRTMLFDRRTLAWDEELLRVLRVPRSLLPEVRGSSEVYGRVRPALPGGGAPVASIAGDQQAALFGQMCLTPGLAKNTYGTGCFLLQNTGDFPVASHHRLLSTVAWTMGGRTAYALEGSVFIGGAVVQWMRDGLGVIRESHEIEALAASVPDSGGVYFVPAFAGLGAPHWDPYARGAIVGITRGTRAGPHRPGGDRGHGVPGRRRPDRDGEGLGHRPSGAARGRRSRGQRSVAAVPGRPAGRAGGAPRGDRDDGARRRLPRGSRRRILGVHGADRGSVAGRAALRAPDRAFGGEASLGALAGGGRAVEGVGEGAVCHPSELGFVDLRSEEIPRAPESGLTGRMHERL